MPSMSAAARALLDHPAECCRWPLGDGWCVRKATDREYCREHHQLSVAPMHEFSAVVTDRMLRSIAMRIAGRRRAA